MSKVQMPEKKRREKVSGGHFEAGKQAFAMLLLRVGKSWSAVASRCVPEVVCFDHYNLKHASTVVSVQLVQLQVAIRSTNFKTSPGFGRCSSFVLSRHAVNSPTDALGRSTARKRFKKKGGGGGSPIKSLYSTTMCRLEAVEYCYQYTHMHASDSQCL